MDLIPFTPDLHRHRYMQHNEPIVHTTSSIAQDNYDNTNNAANTSINTPVKINNTSSLPSPIRQVQPMDNHQLLFGNSPGIASPNSSMQHSQLLQLHHHLRFHNHHSPLKNLTSSPHQDMSLPMLPPSPPSSLQINLFEEKVKKYWKFVSVHEQNIDMLLQQWYLGPAFGANNSVNPIEKIHENGV